MMITKIATTIAYVIKCKGFSVSKEFPLSPHPTEKLFV